MTEAKLNQRPRTKFQKQYANVFTYNGKTITHFPGRLHVAIPEMILRSKGIEPNEQQLKSYAEIWKLTKSPSPISYSCIEDFIVFSDIPEYTIFLNFIWLVKNQKAILNADKMGRATYFKFIGIR